MGAADAIVKYADDYWYRPSATGLVMARGKAGMAWAAGQGVISINEQILKNGKKVGDWVGAFLNYGSAGNEGLFIIDKAEQAKGRADWRRSSCPSAIFISSFKDRPGDESADLAKDKPPYYGLNDCTYFTTQCLAQVADLKGLQTDNAGTFYGKGLESAKTQTLVQTMKASDAAVIVRAGVLTPGDSIVYSKSATEHHHAVIYLGKGGIAMHTISNHPDQKHATPMNWLTAAHDDEHALVTMFHMDIDGPRPAAMQKALGGWWSADYGGRGKYFYFFSANGRLSWVTKAPAAGAKEPYAPANQRGYWFHDATKQEVTISWKSSGSVERFKLGATAATSNIDITWMTLGGDTPGKISKIS